jgi:hypothetical protein
MRELVGEYKMAQLHKGDRTKKSFVNLALYCEKWEALEYSEQRRPRICQFLFLKYVVLRGDICY